jgi:hypothetical protein
MSCDRLHRYRRSVGCHGLHSAGPELVVIIPVVDNGRGLGFGGPIRKQLEMVQDPPETRALAQRLTRYRQPNNARGIFESAAIGLVCCWQCPRRACSFVSS